jgi:hypothetical protein
VRIAASIREPRQTISAATTQLMATPKGELRHTDGDVMAFACWSLIHGFSTLITNGAIPEVAEGTERKLATQMMDLLGRHRSSGRRAKQPLNPSASHAGANASQIARFAHAGLNHRDKQQHLPHAVRLGPLNAFRSTNEPSDGKTCEMHMMRRVALSSLVAGLLALISGCVKSHDVGGISADLDAGDDGMSVVPDASEPVSNTPGPGLCTRFAAIQCAGEQRCCDAPTRTVERCESDLAQNCEQTAYLDQIAVSPLSGFDASAAELAFTELEQRTSRCDPSIAGFVLSDQGLRGAFLGTLAQGESCDPVGGVTGNRGVVAASLSACKHAQGLACLPASLIGGWSCAPKQAVGQSCLTDDNCESSAACNNFSEPALGSCVAHLPLGAACTYASECESLYCDGQSCVAADVQAVYCPAS